MVRVSPWRRGSLTVPEVMDGLLSLPYGVLTRQVGCTNSVLAGLTNEYQLAA
jgi:hypothetical protein